MGQFPNPDTQFKPGWKGGPGRPAKRTLDDRLRAVLDSAEFAGKKVPGGKTIGDMIVEQVIAKALKGDTRLLAYIWERHDGKAIADSTVVTNGNPTRIIVEYDDNAGVGGAEGSAPEAPQGPGPDPEGSEAV